MHVDLEVRGGGYHQYFEICPVAPLAGGPLPCTVLMWNDAREYDCTYGGTCDQADVEVVIFHGSTTELRYQYRDLHFLNGIRTTVGIEDADAVSTGLLYACDTPGSVYSGLAVSFYKEPEGGDLEISLDSDTPSAPTGGTITSTITVVNHGPLDQTEVTVKDPLPAELLYMGNTCGAAWDGTTLTWNIGPLMAGETASCRVTATSTSCGVILNTVTVQGSVTDEIPSSNLATLALNEALNPLSDPGFEGGIPSSAWEEVSLTYGTPLCSVSRCGNGAGTSLPRTGEWWAWFGGAAGPETAYLEQEMIMPAGGEAFLSFWLWNGDTGMAGVDRFQVLMDGAEVFRAAAGHPWYTSGYAEAKVDLSPWADGKPHRLRFQGVQTSRRITNFSLDDVSLVGCAPTVFSDDFGDGTPLGDPDWKEISGEWRVSEKGAYSSSAGRNNIALAAWSQPEGDTVTTGRLRASVSLLGPTAVANGAIIFAWQGKGRFRYVRLRPGRLEIGQVGDAGGGAAGVRASFPARLKVGRARLLTVDLYPDGLVRARLDGLPAGRHRFPNAPGGKVGLWAKRATTSFDDFAVFDEGFLP
jgi:uncharacterized repeat protein (TIGR01451 family)